MRDALQSLFAVLVSIFAFDLVLLCTLTCAVGVLVLMSSEKPFAWPFSRSSEESTILDSSEESTKAHDSTEATDDGSSTQPRATRNRSATRRLASQALLGALVGSTRPDAAHGQQITSLGATQSELMLCNGKSIRDWAFRTDEEGFQIELTDVAISCPWLVEPIIALESMRLRWTPALDSQIECDAPLVKLGNKSADPCALALANLDPLRRAIFLETEEKNEDPGSQPAPPRDEWKQVLIFVICFLGAGAILEVLMIVFMPTSLTRCLRGSAEDVPGSRRLRSTSATSPLEECFVGSSGASTSSVILEPQHDALASLQRIPLHARILVPFFTVACIALFISANVAVGASVELTVEYDHKSFWPPWRHHDTWIEHLYGPYNVFAFSLANTVTEMYQAGVYILALLVLVWSGIWPYLKLVLLLVCWITPPRFIPVKVRGGMLVVFDALGKWCMIDIFLMVMMSVAFRFHVVSSEVPYLSWLLPHEFVTLDVTVGSHWGLFGFMLAAITSILVGHVILGYHRTAVASQVSQLLRQRLSVIDEEYRGAFDADFGAVMDDGDADVLMLAETEAEAAEAERSDLRQAETARLAQQLLRKPKRRRYCCSCPQGSYFNVGSDELPLSGRAAAMFDRKEAVADAAGLFPKIAVSFALVATFALILAGALADSFEFTFTGTAARAIRIVQPESSVRRYSLVSIAQAIDPGDDVITPPWRFGVIFMQVVYLLFAMVMPLVQCFFLFALWLVPMRLRDQKIVMMVTELISAFSALDCFIVSIIAACIEINQFAVFLAGDHCDKLEEYTKEPCFGIQTTFLPGCWVTVVAAAALFTVNQFVVRMCDKILRDRELDPVLFAVN
ncbi:Hypothetical Protein FCC1311_016062 [Hondaea fermentalgiana]|uniref:Uncharacterized protein n=1 Tax=Hondaea fermentalgiana TaxID=2315210 RepID=A0A2R5G6H2_9STRA|nr:Hypothetical Protein FCC1311_016062 [Hondaea fermentalgiana]|eukprot:GBG25388.1 Hypothetical Protein FCC1311_016062 [Hondaea fermentalgiana]